MIIKLTTLDGITRRKDRSVTMRFTTCIEQTSEELKILDMMFQQNVLVALKPETSKFLDAELKDLDSVDLDLEDNTKSQSKRIRNVLWRVLESNLKREPTKSEFSDFYRAKTENIISHFKSKIDE